MQFDDPAMIGFSIIATLSTGVTGKIVHALLRGQIKDNIEGMDRRIDGLSKDMEHIHKDMHRIESDIEKIKGVAFDLLRGHQP